MTWRVNPKAAAQAVAGVLVASCTGVTAQRRGAASVALDPDDIGGVVSSAKGADAGVRVIAETATDRRVDDRVPSTPALPARRGSSCRAAGSVATSTPPHLLRA